MTVVSNGQARGHGNHPRDRPSYSSYHGPLGLRHTSNGWIFIGPIWPHPLKGPQDSF